MSSWRYAYFAGALFILALCFAVWRNDLELKRRLVQDEARLEQMEADHKQAMKAVEMALAEREKAHAENAERNAKADAAIGACPDFSAMPLPDEWLLLWHSENGNCSLQPSGKTAGGHKAAEPPGHEDDGGHAAPAD